MIMAMKPPNKKTQIKSSTKTAAKTKKIDENKLIKEIEVLSPEKKEKIITSMIAQQHMFYSGPIPPASELSAYKKIATNIPNRIIAMAEKEQERQMFMSKQYDKYKTRGQLCALSTVLGAFLLAGFMTYMDHPWVGFGISFSAIASVALAFIYGKRSVEVESKKDN